MKFFVSGHCGKSETCYCYEKVKTEKENMTRSYMTYADVANTRRSDIKRADDANKHLQELILQKLEDFDNDKNHGGTALQVYQ
ncbi:hypothetical protein GCK72_017043 [Caenorhabditis remanei]|uniref:Uncharacterized protein n=1 Tax=Caenorhabditis remanei TaxID=31234 RepID=A0A6A5G6S9_CAERE|nr:hypothetical protein GCK72_017043 [Caenorhabditis remanei]KAF1750493.1 hypothetical protein GCK72_017043 [Caenorhabditis remanei]